MALGVEVEMSVGASVQLRDAVARARETLAAHPEGRVTLPERGAIWHALGEVEGPGSLGHRRRAHLARLAAERVKPVWDETFPDDRAVEELLAEARRAVDGGVDYDAANSRITGFWHALFDRMTHESRYRGVYAGQAACGALRVAIDDEPVGLADQGLDQYDLDAEEQDTAFLASLAYGGGEGESAYRPELRREFWEWYLDEAVPAAWRSA